MTRKELEHYDGKDGRPAYIAYMGKVYDMSSSPLWEGGNHMGKHEAGQDMTDHLPMAPHTVDMLSRVKLVGTLDPEPATADPKATLRALYRKYHPHPVVIHFPIALVLFACLMQAVYLVAGANHGFDLTALYALIAATVSIPPAAGAGALSWWINYDLKMTPIFKTKLICTGLAFVFTSTAVWLRLTGGSHAAYTVLMFMSAPCVMLVAQSGGKLTWPDGEN